MIQNECLNGDLCGEWRRGETICGDEGDGYMCTRIAGHTGDHVACDEDGQGRHTHNCASWHNDAPDAYVDAAQGSLDMPQQPQQPQQTATRVKVGNDLTIVVTEPDRDVLLELIGVNNAVHMVHLTNQEAKRMLRAIAALIAPTLPPPIGRRSCSDCGRSGVYYYHGNLSACRSCNLLKSNMDAWLLSLPSFDHEEPEGEIPQRIED